MAGVLVVASVRAFVATGASVTSMSSMIRTARMISPRRIRYPLLCIRMRCIMRRVGGVIGMCSRSIMVGMIPRASSMILAVVIRMRVAH